VPILCAIWGIPIGNDLERNVFTMRGRKNVWRLVAVLLCVGLLAAACGDDDDDTDTGAEGTTAPGGGGDGNATCEEGTAIGFFGALTGADANLGIEIRNGAELAVEQFNEANADCQVTLEEYDSQGSPDLAPALADEAISNDDVLAIVGPAFSGESRAANPKFDEAGLPIITASATAVDLSEQGWKVFHRALASDGKQGPAVAAYIKDTLKPETAGVIDDNSEYGKGLANIVRDELGDAVKANDTIDPKATSFSAAVTKMKDADVDVIFFGGYYSAAGPLAKQLRDAGVESTLVFADGVKDPAYVEGAQAAAEGSLITCPCAPGDTNPEFAEAFEAKFGAEPGTYAAEAYDSANVMLAGIASGITTREAMLEFINSYDAPGITKQMKWDENGEPAGGDIYVYEVEGGKIVGKGTI
jgi:branched-chain amino acid transport system substrate-binding protein